MAFAHAAADILSTLGVSATYDSLLSGAIPLTVIIERAIEVLDEGGGAYAHKPMATIRSGLVTPKRGDVIETATERWSVEQMDSDDGYLMRVWVQKKL